MNEEELYKVISEYLDENGVEALVQVLCNALKDYNDRNKEERSCKSCIHDNTSICGNCKNFDEYENKEDI